MLFIYSPKQRAADLIPGLLLTAAWAFSGKRLFVREIKKPVGKP
jgi:hypothetical protein